MTEPAGGPGDVRTSEGSESYGVVVADNDDDVRMALADLIDEHPVLHLVGEAVDGLTAADLCAEHLAHLAVVDVRMPHGGVQAVEAIRARCPSTVVVAFTTLADGRTRRKLLRAGAAAVFVKGGSYDLVEELVALARRPDVADSAS